MNVSVESLKQELLAHGPWAALTGAGVSAASGIPTYRDHDGRWLGSAPIQHQEFIEDEEKRRRYWSRSVLGWPRVGRAIPNQTHSALTRLQQINLLHGVITQTWTDCIRPPAPRTSSISMADWIKSVASIAMRPSPAPRFRNGWKRTTDSPTSNRSH